MWYEHIADIVNAKANGMTSTKNIMELILLLI